MQRRTRQHWSAVDELQRLIGDIGGECWAAGPTAAALYGFDGVELVKPFHLVVPYERKVQRLATVIHRTSSMPLIDRTMVEGVAATTATRVLIDEARHLTPERLTIAADSALRDLWTTEDFLHRRMVEMRSRGRKGIGKLLDVLVGREAIRGGHSWLERRFLELSALAGLPSPATQAVVGKRSQRLIRVDVRYPDTPVVVELLGYASHRSVMQLQADAERMNQMVLDGLVVLQYTYLHVTDGPAAMIAEVTATLARYKPA